MNAPTETAQAPTLARAPTVAGAADLPDGQAATVPNGKGQRAAKAQARGAVTTPATAKLEPLKRGDLQLAEFQNYDWCGVACAGAEPTDYSLNSAMWVALGECVHVYDIVRLVARDASWFGMYLITCADPAYTDAKLLISTTLPPRHPLAERSLPEGYNIRQGNPGEERWVVERVADGYIMNLGHDHRSHEAARRFLLDLAIFRASMRPEYLP